MELLILLNFQMKRNIRLNFKTLLALVLTLVPNGIKSPIPTFVSLLVLLYTFSIDIKISKNTIAHGPSTRHQCQTVFKFGLFSDLNVNTRVTYGDWIQCMFLLWKGKAHIKHYAALLAYRVWNKRAPENKHLVLKCLICAIVDVMTMLWQRHLG